MDTASYSARKTPRDGERRLHSATTFTRSSRPIAVLKAPGFGVTPPARRSISANGTTPERTSTIRRVAATMADKRSDVAGAAAVMPLGSPIGSNRGVKTRELVEILAREIKVPVIVDAGLGSPSDACECMEMGCAAVLVNTAIAIARDPVTMAGAFRNAVSAGRSAYLAGLASAGSEASASSPLTGFLRDETRQE